MSINAGQVHGVVPDSDTIVASVQNAYNDAGGLAYAAMYSRIADDITPILGAFIARGDGDVLDLGCGAGRYMAWLEGRGLNVTGVDVSSGMLRRAREHVRGSLVAMDMRSLGFRGRRFAGVFCASSLHHLPKAAVGLALGEMNRVMVRKGVLFLNVKEGEGEGFEHGNEFGSVERFFSRYRPQEIGQFLTDAGFTIVRSEASRIQDPRGRHWLRVLATTGP